MVTKKAADKDKATLAIADVTDEMLRNVASVDDAMALAFELYGQQAVSAADHLGNGFVKVEEKDALLNKPLFILASKFHGGDWGEFVTCFAITMDEAQQRVMFSDGSTGVYQNCKELIERTGVPGGWIVKNGLRKSEYPTCIACGRPRGTAAETCENMNGACGDTEEKRGKGVTYYFDAA